MSNDTTANVKEKMILFLICPIIAFLYSLQDVKTRSSYLVFFLICILFGWMFVADFEAADSFRYKNEFLSFAVSPDYNMKFALESYFSENSLDKDIYHKCLYWLAAKIGGNNYHFFFLLGAVVFSFFFLKSMKYVTDNPNFQQGFYCMVLLFLFAYSNPIFNINGIRFWTASWVGVYVLFKLVVDHNYWYFLLLVLLPTMHISMFLLWAVFALSWLLRSHINGLIPLLFISFLISASSLLLVNYFQSFLPPVLYKLIWSYTQSSNALDRLNSEGVLYAQVLNYLPTLLLMLMTFLLIYNHKKIVSKKSREVFGFYLAFFTIINFLSAIPSVGRFTYLTIPFLIYVWVDNFEITRKYNKYVLLVPVAYAYSFLYFIRNMSAVSDTVFYLTPLPFQIFYHL